MMRPQTKLRRQAQNGFALFSALILVLIVGVVAVGGLTVSESAEIFAGNAIQRSRAFQSAEAGLIVGEARVMEAMLDRRVFASEDGSSTVFTRDTLREHWWRDDNKEGVQRVDAEQLAGVQAGPEYTVEEIGHYISDGGSGIVSLDRGAGVYGRKTGSGRELILYRLQSYGTGSSDAAKAVVESHVVVTQ